MPIRRLLAFLLLLVAAPAAGQVARVENTATLTFRTGGETRTVRSNTVTLGLEGAKRPTTLSFRLPPPDHQFTGMSCRTTPVPTFTPAPIDAAVLAASPPLGAFDIYEDAIVVLENQAGNHDPQLRETAVISADVGAASLAVALLETARDSGVFAGGIPATATGRHPDLVACDVRRTRGERLHLSFGEDEFSLASETSLLIDPAGFVFDSRTGETVDGAVVSLVDANGAPATVFGDDGVSRYPSVMTSGETVTDASGRVYPGRPGRYRFPLTFPGTYFLKVDPPGDYTAPSVVPLATLRTLRDADGQPFILNDASFGGALTLSTPDPFYADIPVDRAGAGALLLLAKSASVREAAPGDVVRYQLRLQNRGDRPARGLVLRDTLPPGLRYRRGSTRGAREPTGTGRALAFALPDLPPGATAEFGYLASVAPGAPPGEALNRARAEGAEVRSNEAVAAVRLRPLLFSDALTVIGRVTEGDCRTPDRDRRGVPGVRLLLEDGTFTVTDRDGLYHFEGVPAGRHVVQMDAGSLPDGLAPAACDGDTRAAGSAISRFVEGVGGLPRRVDFRLERTGRPAAAPAADALPIAPPDDAEAAGNRDWMHGLTAGTDWLFPGEGHNPRAPVQRVVVKHAADERIALFAGDRPVDPLLFDGAERGAAASVSRWTGIPLAEGDNRLVARVLGPDGRVRRVLERVVRFSGPGVRATLSATHSRLRADGLTRPLLAVRVVDAAGRPVRAGTPVPFRVEPPYRPAADAALEQRRQLAGRERTETVTHVVGDDGLAFLALQPTTQAGAVRATVLLADGAAVRTGEVRAWLAAPARDWVVVGFGAGSVGYDTLRTRGGALPRGRRGGTVTDGRLALYAKGRIRGSWLLTAAYDSDRRHDPDRGLLGTIDPDRYYTVYGDGSVQGYDAPAARKLYLRLERREAYALFGDFETGLTDAQLTRYSRTLHGAKAAWQGRDLAATGFAATADTRYGRDEIQGNGLSGPYRLTARDIVPNSDKLRIETRDRFRSERIVASRALTRHIDYDIDARAGTLRFREPVLSRDAALNPVFIVAEYEVEGGRSGKLVAAGRVAARLGRVTLGAGAIRDRTAGDAAVAGLDVRAKLGRTELRGEIAGGGRAGLGDGMALLAEAEHHGPGVDLLLYARQQDAAFGVGQQNLVEAGTRKLGLDARIALTDALALTATGWRQEQLVGPGTRIAGEARLERRGAAGTMFAGVQVAADRGLDGRARDSLLLTLGGSRALGDRLTLSGQTQVAPGGRKASVDFPVRHRITAAYRITPGIRVLAGYEIADGAQFAARTAQLGFDLAPWAGAKLTSTLNQQAVGEAGPRTFAQYGLSQSLPLGKRWSVDATLDAASTVRGRIPPLGGVNAFHPAASGGFLSPGQVNGDHLAATLGATYRGPRWSANGRIERRSADAESRWGLTANVLRAIGEGRTLASGVRAYTVRDAGGARADYLSADVALAWRPPGSRWSVLNRLELRHERADARFAGSDPLGTASVAGTDGTQATTRAINNLALHYRGGSEAGTRGWEASLYHGAKYVRGRFADDRYSGLIDVAGFELRRDVARRVDVGVQGSVSHAWSHGAWAWSGGPTLGVSPAGDIWISAGYNLAGYRDRDFDDDRYTRQGAYLTMRVKFDQTLFGRRP